MVSDSGYSEWSEYDPEIHKVGWKTWAVVYFDENLCEGKVPPTHIYPEGNKYRINFLSKDFKIIDEIEEDEL